MNEEQQQKRLTNNNVHAWDFFVDNIICHPCVLPRKGFCQREKMLMVFLLTFKKRISILYLSFDYKELSTRDVFSLENIHNLS